MTLKIVLEEFLSFGSFVIAIAGGLACTNSLMRRPANFKKVAAIGAVVFVAGMAAKIFSKQYYRLPW